MFDMGREESEDVRYKMTNDVYVSKKQYTVIGVQKT